jgi:hypothetical protein
MQFTVHEHLGNIQVFVKWCGPSRGDCLTPLFNPTAQVRSPKQRSFLNSVRSTLLHMTLEEHYAGSVTRVVVDDVLTPSVSQYFSVYWHHERVVTSAVVGYARTSAVDQTALRHSCGNFKEQLPSVDTASKFYSVLRSLQRLLAAVFGPAAAGCGDCVRSGHRHRPVASIAGKSILRAGRRISTRSYKV